MTETMPRNFGARTARRSSWIDTVIDNAVAFIQKLSKQMFITIIVSLFKAAADALVKSSDEAVSNTLRGNMGTSGTNTTYPNRQSNYNNNQYESDYYSRYGANETRSTTSNFPGFGS